MAKSIVSQMHVIPALPLDLNSKIGLFDTAFKFAADARIPMYLVVCQTMVKARKKPEDPPHVGTTGILVGYDLLNKRAITAINGLASLLRHTLMSILLDVYGEKRHFDEEALRSYGMAAGVLMPQSILITFNEFIATNERGFRAGEVPTTNIRMLSPGSLPGTTIESTTAIAEYIWDDDLDRMRGTPRVPG